MPKKRRILGFLRWGIPVASVVAATVLLVAIHDARQRSESPFPLMPTNSFHPVLASFSAPDELPLALDAVQVPMPLVIDRGQTIGGLLGELGLSPREVVAAVDAMGEHVDVRKIRAGAQCLAYFDPGDQSLAMLRLGLGRDGWLELARDDSAGWSTHHHAFTVTREIRQVRGEVYGALEQAVRTAGGDPRVAYRMADVLQWDLDFNRDLRPGDQFEVLYEQRYLDGTYDGPGGVLAMVYENRGLRYEAYRWGEDEAYYDADGRPLQKLFLRSPLPFTRVTSRFNLRRFHPVLKVHRPHYGVDYGAPTGTPVRVTASGVVEWAARKGGAGKMVKVRHPNGYKSAYLHLSGYAKGVSKGARVKQGQVIGYVGSTGLSTGPHLDYRIQKNGKWIDPLKLDLVPADPIPQHQLADFLKHRDLLRHSLSSGEPLPESEDRLAAGAAAPLSTSPSRAR